MCEITRWNGWIIFCYSLFMVFGYPLMSNSPIYYSLLTGINYYQHIPEKITIGYIPLSWWGL